MVHLLDRHSTCSWTLYQPMKARLVTHLHVHVHTGARCVRKNPQQKQLYNIVFFFGGGGGVPDAPTPCARTEKRMVTFNST